MEEIKDILNVMCGVGEDKDYIINKIEELKKENKKLKKENKINKQVIKILHKKCYPPGRSGRARSSGGLWGGGISVLERNEKLGFGMATIGR